MPKRLLNQCLQEYDYCDLIKYRYIFLLNLKYLNLIHNVSLDHQKLSN